MLKNVPKNYNHNQTNPKLQPKHKKQPNTQPPDVVVHTKKRTTTTKEKNTLFKDKLRFYNTKTLAYQNLHKTSSKKILVKQTCLFNRKNFIQIQLNDGVVYPPSIYFTE